MLDLGFGDDREIDTSNGRLNRSIENLEGKQRAQNIIQVKSRQMNVREQGSEGARDF